MPQLDSDEEDLFEIEVGVLNALLLIIEGYKQGVISKQELLAFLLNIIFQQ